MAVAKVIVDLALDKEFDYEIPEELAERVKVGTMVSVPFGKSRREGYVLSLAETSSFAGTVKPILGHLRRPRPCAGTPGGARPLDGRLLLLHAGAGDPDAAARRRAERQGQTEKTQALPHRRPRGGFGLCRGQRAEARRRAAGRSAESTALRRRAADRIAEGVGAGVFELVTADAGPQGNGRNNRGAGPARCLRRQQGHSEQTARTVEGSEEGARTHRQNAARRNAEPRPAAARRDQLRQNRGVPSGHRDGACTREVRDRAGAGDFADAADRAPLPGPVRRRTQHPAQPPVGRGTVRRVEPDQRRRGEDRGRSAVGALRARSGTSGSSSSTRNTSRATSSRRRLATRRGTWRSCAASSRERP